MIEINGRKIGTGHPAYIVAEIGINHGGDTAVAVQMMQAAKDCGCDAVKFQNYKTDTFIHQRSEFWEYRDKNGRLVRERQEDLFRRCEMDKGRLRWLKNQADRIGIDMFSTPMCLDGLQECIDLEFPILKNGSDCLKNLPLIAAMGKTGLPTVISTGMCETLDICEAISTFTEFGRYDNLILLHCVSAYPAPDKEMNIRRMGALRNLFGKEVGLSDHSQGITAAVLSVALASVFYEAHFTLDKNLPGPDHSFSKDPAEMIQIVDAIRKAEKQIGNGWLGMQPIEKQNRKAWFV